MAFLDAFDCWQTETATIVRDSAPVYNPVTGVTTKGENTIGTATCILYKNSSSETVFAEMIKTKASHTAIFDPGTDIQRHDTLTINSKKYDVVDPDNVGYTDEALVCSLEEIT